MVTAILAAGGSSVIAKPLPTREYASDLFQH